MSLKILPVRICSGNDDRRPVGNSAECWIGKMLNTSSSGYKNILYYWFPVLLYCTLIYIQSSYPSPQSIPRLPYIDKVLHLGGYAVLGALFLRALRTLPFKNRLRLVMFLSILLSSLYGISDEIHQHYVPYRNADVMDALADAVGSVLGVFAYQSFWPDRRPRI